MFCPNCGQQIHDSASMCEYCGYELEQYRQRVAVLPQYAPNQTVQAVPQSAQQYTMPQQGAYQAAATVMTPEKRENVVAGIVGAIVGAAIGGGSIILLSQLGIIAALSGVLLAVCTLKGYELLGGKLSTVGLVICLVLMLVTPYFADRLDWAIMAMNELDLSMGEAFQAIPQMLDEGYSSGIYVHTIDSGDYYANLGMLYLFVVMGAVSTVTSAFKGRRK